MAGSCCGLGRAAETTLPGGGNDLQGADWGKKEGRGQSHVDSSRKAKEIKVRGNDASKDWAELLPMERLSGMLQERTLTIRVRCKILFLSNYLLCKNEYFATLSIMGMFN